MTRLKKRIAGVGTASQQATGAYHPVGTPETPMVMPLALVSYQRVQKYPFGAMTYEELYPQWTADGGVLVPARPNYPAVKTRGSGRA